MKRIFGSSLLIALLPALPAGANPPTAADPKFSESTEVTVVEVPVQVVRDGVPVRGLKASDFEVHEGRKQHPITGFDVVDLAAAENQLLSASIPAAGRRHFLLLFDLSNSKPRSIVKAQKAVIDSLVKTLTPSDLAAVAVYSSTTGLRLVLGFTSDLRRILQAVASLGLGQIGPGTSQASDSVLGAAELAKAVHGIGARMEEMATEGPPAPRADLTLAQNAMAANAWALAQSFMNEFQQLLINFEAGEVDAQRTELAQQKNAVAALSRAFADFAHMMADISGRKLVVLFSEGFDSTIVQGDEDQNDQEAMIDATMRGGSLGVDDQQRFGSTREANQLAKMLEQFRRADCVIEAVNIAGLEGQDLDEQVGPGRESSLVQLARDTGGELFHNTNDLGDAMVRLAKRTSVTYVLSFQPEGLAANGVYHPIKVQLKNAQRGTEVSYRAGYFAPRPYSQRSPMQKRLAAAEQLSGGKDAGSIGTSVLVAPFRAAAGRSYVPVLIEADGASLLAGGAGKVLPAELYVYAVDANGLIQDFFDQKMQLDVEKAGPALRQGGLKYFGHLELPPGDYSVRVLVRNGETGAFGKRVVLATVPEFGAGKPALLAPLFPEPGGRWAVVREAPRGQQKDAAFPFMVGQQPYLPASRPILKPGQDTAVALVGYNLGSEIRTEGKIEGADGRDLGSCAIRLSGREAGSESRPDVLKAAFRPPRDLAPGNYRLVVTVTGAGGAQTVTSPFTVAAAAAEAGHT
jgi:VWFA-related protein